MTEHPPSDDPRRLDRSFRLWASMIVGVVLAGSALLGFLAMPLAQSSQIGLDAWSAICRAVGIDPGTPAMRQPTSTSAPLPVSKVAWDPAILNTLAAGNRTRGAQLAGEVCSACHGDEGVSPSPDFPHLAGQSAAAIYKQLHDYKTGARVHPSMTPMAMKLTDQQLADVAAYYAGDNAFGSLGTRRQADYENVAELVAVGAPERGIPSCNSCHGSGVGGPIETPTLVGQHAEYLDAQLTAYAAGVRRNDVYQRMRTISARLTPDERRRLAQYYQGTR
jgi:cytochrome c553